MVSLFQLLAVSLLTVISVNCQNSTTTAVLPAKCNNDPLASCYQIFMSEIYNAGKAVSAYCRAMIKYIKCLEDATCDCKLGVNVKALTTSTQFAHLLNYYNCSGVLNEDTNVSPGFNCSGGVTPGDPEVEGLLVMSLEILDSVTKLENQCAGIKQCYKTYSDAAGIALYRKSLGSFCSANEEFLVCYENASCACGQNRNTDIINVVDAERTDYNKYCSILKNGVYFGKGIKCEGDVPIDVCNQSNPIFDCFESYKKSTFNAGKDKTVLCPAFKDYLDCTEATACKCGLTNSSYVFQELTLVHAKYDYQKCDEVSGAIQIQFGINCPGGETPGDPEVEGLLVMSLETLDSVTKLENQCAGIKQCFKIYSDAAGISLYNKSLGSLCSAYEEFLVCYENASCACGQNRNTDIITMVDLVRQQYNKYCSILTNGVFFEKGIKCEGDVPIDVCEQTNPIFDCFESYRKSTFNAGTDTNIFCPAFKDYLNCTEATACKCGLTKSPNVLQELTLAHANYDYQKCNEVSGAIQIQFGINCPENGTSENEVLETLGLMENNVVLKAIQDCHTVEKCYRIKDMTSARALHEKNVTAMCQTYSDFIHCIEQASCLCGRFLDPIFRNNLNQAKRKHRGICPADTTIRDFYSCDACALSTSQNLNNPIDQCRLDYEKSTKSAPNDINLTCPGYKSLLKCVEGTACSCGLKKSISILQTLTFAHSFYDANNCTSISGEFPIKFGVNCPYDNTNGTSANEILTSMGMLEIEGTLQYVSMCPALEQCIKRADADMAKALHEKNAAGYCRAGSVYVHCVEDTKCGCENADFKKFAASSRKQHLANCVDTSFNETVTCD